MSRTLLPAAALLLGGAATPAAAFWATESAAIVAPTSAPAADVRLAAMGDVPTVPRRRGGGRRAQAKDKPYQPLAKDPAAESDAAHKDYLKRYGF